MRPPNRDSMVAVRTAAGKYPAENDSPVYRAGNARVRDHYQKPGQFVEP
jgi:hypothetical protein